VALVGYARVSTRDQHPEAQTDALVTAGCEKTFIDHASGTLAKRPALDEALTERRVVPRARRLQAVADLISPLVVDYPKGQAGRAASN